MKDADDNDTPVYPQSECVSIAGNGGSSERSSEGQIAREAAAAAVW